MVILKCKMCGGSLTIPEDSAIATCEYCGSQQTFTKSKDEVIANLFNRANNMRLKCEFDKAQDVYEKILNEDDTDPESHWGIVLCKYGIEYVEDPTTFNRIPTCHRTHYESILADADYLAVLELAEPLQREIYTAEANAISKLQKEILAIVQHEKPFDVFICYKQTDNSGKRTQDSVIANDIYYQLTQEGFKVFYSAITLEDKLGQEYEPYIFAALNSATVMLVVGTKPEYFNAVWVKNEWGRYLQLMRKDRSRTLIPCYRDMDAYDLPEEFSHLQAQDMGKIGFINDIVRGVKKLVHPDSTTQNVGSSAQSDELLLKGTVDTILERIQMFIEDEDYIKADQYCERVLDADPRDARVYLAKLLIEFRVPHEEMLAGLSLPIENSKNYMKILRFGTPDLIARLEGYSREIQTRLEQEEAGRKEQLEREKIERENRGETEADYIDIECPYCGEFLSWFPSQLKAEYVTCPICDMRIESEQILSQTRE